MLKVFYAVFVYSILMTFVALSIKFYEHHNDSFYLNWFDKCLGNNKTDDFTYCAYVRSNECLSQMSIFEDTC